MTITIKGTNESALLARIERELKGEDVEIYMEEDEEVSLENIMAYMGYNAKQSRIYLGRLVRNTQRMYESSDKLVNALLPMGLYFQYLLDEVESDIQTSNGTKMINVQEILKSHKATAERLKAEGKAPKDE